MKCCNDNKNKTWVIILAVVLLYILYCDVDICGLFGGGNDSDCCYPAYPPYCRD